MNWEDRWLQPGFRVEGAGCQVAAPGSTGVIGATPRLPEGSPCPPAPNAHACVPAADVAVASAFTHQALRPKDTSHSRRPVSGSTEPTHVYFHTRCRALPPVMV